jgi:hypothetical protein
LQLDDLQAEPEPSNPLTNPTSSSPSTTTASSPRSLRTACARQRFSCQRLLQLSLDLKTGSLTPVRLQLDDLQAEPEPSNPLTNGSTDDALPATVEVLESDLVPPALPPRPRPLPRPRPRPRPPRDRAAGRFAGRHGRGRGRPFRSYPIQRQRRSERRRRPLRPHRGLLLHSTTTKTRSTAGSTRLVAKLLLDSPVAMDEDEAARSEATQSRDNDDLNGDELKQAASSSSSSSASRPSLAFDDDEDTVDSGLDTPRRKVEDRPQQEQQQTTDEGDLSNEAESSDEAGARILVLVIDLRQSKKR